MKRYIPRLFVSVLTVLLLCCGVSVAAEEEYVNRLTGVAVAEGYELVLLDEQDNTVTQTTDTVNSVETDVYKNVVKMKLTINDATAREYVVMLLDGGTKVPGDANIRYIDQKSGPGVLEFLVYPDQMTQPGDYTLMVFSGGTQSEAATFTVAEEPKVELFNLYGASMVLGNELAMNFYIKVSDVKDGYYAEVTKTYADGTPDYVEIVEMADWKMRGTTLYYVKFNGIYAMEMADDICVEIFDAEGNQVSNKWMDSIRAYAERVLKNSTKATEKTLVVDMLNYGAAAQEYFSYNVDDLANATLTEAQKALATAKVTTSNNQVKGDKFIGSSLTLDSNILMTMYFENISRAMNAIVTFTDYENEGHSINIRGEDFSSRGSYLGVKVEELAVADARMLVDCKIYDGETLVASGIDSIESIADRSGENLFDMIMRFSTSAYKYFEEN